MKKSLMKYMKAFSLFGIIASVLVLSSCGDDDTMNDNDDDDGTAPTESLLELIDSTEGLDSLSKYLNRYPSLVAALSASGDKTLFAPTNAAFVGLLQTPGFPASIDLINPDIIEGVIAYHVVNGTNVTSDDFTEGNQLNTLYTDPATSTVQVIDFNDDGTVLTGSTTTNIVVAQADILATNGIMHTTESVLIPPSVGATLTPILGTLAGTILLGADFSILAEGITKADAGKDAAATISAALASVADLTVFAPTNATFESASVTVDTYDAATWDAIIRNHVVVGDGSTVAPEDLTTGATFTTLGGGTLLIFNDTETIAAMNGIGIYMDSNGDVDLMDAATLTNFDAEVAAPDVVNISQGRIHVIAGVLSPL